MAELGHQGLRGGVGFDRFAGPRRRRVLEHFAEIEVDPGIARVGALRPAQHPHARLDIAGVVQRVGQEQQAGRRPGPGVGPLRQRAELLQASRFIFDGQGGAERIAVGVGIGGARDRDEPGPALTLVSTPLAEGGPVVQRRGQRAAPARGGRRSGPRRPRAPGPRRRCRRRGRRRHMRRRRSRR